jgi:hypothetical protein
MEAAPGRGEVYRLAYLHLFHQFSRSHCLGLWLDSRGVFHHLDGQDAASRSVHS